MQREIPLAERVAGSSGFARMTSDGNSTQADLGPPPSMSVRDGFARREAARRQARLARFDAAAMQREAFPRHAYYAGELRRLVASLVPAQSRVLEVGCGNGSLLASLNAKVAIGIDISKAAIEHA